MNNQRRIFRGRGGPTDRRLPKHNARRSNSTKGMTTVRTPKYETKIIPKQHAQEEGEEHDKEKFLDEKEIIEGFGDDAIADVTNLGSGDVKSGPLDSHVDEKVALIDDTTEEGDSSVERKKLHSEIKHLRKRIKNTRESIQLSTAIVDPTKYQENVLNVVSKCVNEWRSIIRHYEESIEMDDEQTKAAALALFEIIQHSLQCGPLTGAKPGYFKRCGGQVSKVVYAYLETVVSEQQSGAEMGFTTKQCDALNKWKTNAKKASESNKEPSKSVLKKQQKAQKKKR